MTPGETVENFSSSLTEILEMILERLRKLEAEVAALRAQIPDDR
jgi:hypothetical protein